jgi:hypothetical protein
MTTVASFTGTTYSFPLGGVNSPGGVVVPFTTPALVQVVGTIASVTSNSNLVISVINSTTGTIQASFVETVASLAHTNNTSYADIYTVNRFIALPLVLQNNGYTLQISLGISASVNFQLSTRFEAYSGP